MKILTSIKYNSWIYILVLLLASSCSVFTGSRLSNDPAVAAQQQQIEVLEAELKEAEQYAEEAKQREKAAENRLKAAKHELKALEEQAKRRQL